MGSPLETVEFVIKCQCLRQLASPIRSKVEEDHRVAFGHGANRSTVLVDDDPGFDKLVSDPRIVGVSYQTEG